MSEYFYELTWRHSAIESGKDTLIRFRKPAQIQIRELLMSGNQRRIDESVPATQAVGPEKVLAQFRDPG